MGWDALSRWGKDARRLQRLTGGVANDVWLVEIDGQRAVARLGSRSDADLGWESDLLAHLSSHGLTVPVPIPALDGRRFVDGLVVMPFLEGQPPQSAADWGRVAETLREVHRLTQGWPQRPGWRSSVDLLEEEHGTRIDLTRMPAEAVVRCRAAWARLAGSPNSVIHGDANPRNILITPERVALVDWDEAHVDVSALDLELPYNAAGLDPLSLDIAQQASAAWEAAVCWKDDYAERRLAEVRPV